MSGYDGTRAGGVYGMFGGAAVGGMDGGAGASEQQGLASAQQDTDLSAWTMEETEKALDLVFIMDATGSMGSYIASATKNIETICDNIIRSEQLSGPGALRVGLLAYRDHPPQDHTYIVKNFGFTPEVSEVKANLKTLYASGGGDGPEAVTAAMHALTQMEWRQRATRMAVLIADAPPHGIGEYGDGFPGGSPDGHDPLRIARQMAAAGIPLFVVACEPALSGYMYAADFFQGLVRITGAQLLPLTSASLLAHVIIGAAGEAMDIDRLHRELGDAVADRMKAMSLEASGSSHDIMDEVTRELHQSLRLRNESTKQLHIESIYRDTPASQHNIELYMTAPDLATAKPKLQKFVGSRLNDKYLQTRAASSSYRPYADYPHPRMSSATGIVATDVYAAAHPASSSPPSSFTPSFGAASASPSAGSRKIVSDFSAFSAAPGMTFGSTSGSPPREASASPSFSSPRNATQHSMMSIARGGQGARAGGMMDDDEDSDNEGATGGRSGISRSDRPLPVDVSEDGSVEIQGDDGQRLAFRHGAISMEQVRRLAMQSAYRSGLAS